MTVQPHSKEAARPLSRSLRLLLYVLTALTFVAGTQLFVLMSKAVGSSDVARGCG